MDTNTKQYQINASSNRIALKWYHQPQSIDSYIIKYRDLHGTNQPYRLMETLENEITLKNLKSSTLYEIKLYTQREGEDELVFRVTADTSISIASQFISTSEQIKDKPHVYQLRPMRIDQLTENINMNHMISDIDISDIEKENTKTILFVGASESGKSTLLDALINFVLDVPYADEIRFKMVDDIVDQKAKTAHHVTSRTQYTTCYRIPHKSGFQIELNLQVIDTPGLQDRNGSQNNKEITKQLMALFGSGTITHVNAVCIVLPSSCRLTQEQKDIFEEILSLFGNDINCLIPIVTFDDGGYLNALSALSEAGIPFMHHMHFRFNNASLLCGNESEEAWTKRNESFMNLLESISVNPKQSVKLTEDVLQLRTEIFSDLQLLKHKKRELVRIQSDISQYENEVDYHERIRVDNINYNFIEEELAETKKDIAYGLFINCPNCESKCRTIRETSNCSWSSLLKTLWWGMIQMCSFFWNFSCFKFAFRYLCCICLSFCYRGKNLLECKTCHCMLGNHVKESALYRNTFRKVNTIHNAKKTLFDNASKSKEGLQGKIQELKKEISTNISEFEGLIEIQIKQIHHFNSIALKQYSFDEVKEMEDLITKMKDLNTNSNLDNTPLEYK